MASDELRQAKTEVLAATDLGALIGEYVTLKRSGRSFVALCPFHEEKTPSFHVNPERGTWHCFGRCARGGNAIDFVMAKEGLDFLPALRFLADRAGVRLPERGGRGGGSGDARARALAANEAAAAFYRKALLESREAEGARAYVEARGIDEASAERFGLGYAPAGGRFLTRCLERRGFGAADLVAAGLAGEREGGGTFERFRGRLMFPIKDALGRVLGFGGRALRADDLPKYKNTPETAVFRKRELCYGLHEAKEGLRERGEAAIVEGYLDVILAHQAGFPWVVATLGTAFGAAHASQLRRLVDKVTVLFDGDEAGLKANLRGLEEMAQAVFRGSRPFDELRVALLPDGLDPADVVVQRGPRALGEALEQARSLVDFLVPVDARRWPRERRVEALTRAARVLAAFDSDAYREVQLAEVAHRLGVAESAVRAEAARARRAGAAAAGRAEAQAGGGGPGAGRGGSGGGAGDAPATGDGEASGGALPRVEEYALRCFLASAALLARGRDELALERFEDERARALAAQLYAGRPLGDVADAGARALGARLAAAEPLGIVDEAATWAGVVQAFERRLCERTAPQSDDDASLRAFTEAMRRLKPEQATK